MKLLLRCIACCILVFHPLISSSQVAIDTKGAGAFRYGKIRVNKDEMGFRNGSGGYTRIGWRMFTVDSSNQSTHFFGNHYKNLRNIVKQDSEAVHFLKKAVRWEGTQRIFVGATLIGLGAALLVPMNQQTFGTTMAVNCVAASGVIVSFCFKRWWANRTIRVWNRHLDEGKFRYQP